MVLTNVGVLSGALVSKTTDACRADRGACHRAGLGLDAVGDEASPSPALSSVKRKPAVRPVGNMPVVGSTEVKVQVTSPVLALNEPVTSTYSPTVAVASIRVLVELPARRHLHGISREPEIAELEGAPIEVGGDLLGDSDDLGRSGGRRLVFEDDRVGEGLARGDEILASEAGGAEDVVGIDGAETRGLGLGQDLLASGGREMASWRHAIRQRVGELRGLVSRVATEAIESFGRIVEVIPGAIRHEGVVDGREQRSPRLPKAALDTALPAFPRVPPIPLPSARPTAVSSARGDGAELIREIFAQPEFLGEGVDTPARWPRWGAARSLPRRGRGFAPLYDEISPYPMRSSPSNTAATVASGSNAAQSDPDDPRDHTGEREREVGLVHRSCKEPARIDVGDRRVLGVSVGIDVLSREPGRVRRRESPDRRIVDAPRHQIQASAGASPRPGRRT